MSSTTIMGSDFDTRGDVVEMVQQSYDRQGAGAGEIEELFIPHRMS